MTIPERITQLETQLSEWQARRRQAVESLNQAQAAIYQLQGALALARSLLAEEPTGSPNDEDRMPSLKVVS